jgi:hypothetical protein
MRMEKLDHDREQITSYIISLGRVFHMQILVVCTSASIMALDTSCTGLMRLMYL